MADKPDKRFRDDVNSIIDKDRELGGNLPTTDDRPRIGSRRGAAYDIDDAGEGVSDLEERPDVREYHGDYILQSPDGLYTLVFKPISYTEFDTAEGGSISVSYQPPDDPEDN